MKKIITKIKNFIKKKFDEGGIGILGIIQIILLLSKITGIFSISWLVTLAPTIFAVSSTVILMAAMIIPDKIALSKQKNKVNNLEQVEAKKEVKEIKPKMIEKTEKEQLIELRNMLDQNMDEEKVKVKELIK